MPSFVFDPPPSGAFVATSPDDSRIYVWYDGVTWGGDPGLARMGRDFAAFYYSTPRYTVGNDMARFFGLFCEDAGLKLSAAPQSDLPDGAIP